MNKFPHIFPVACHTNNIGPGSTFVVIKGMKEDGMVYVPQALERGAQNIVVEQTVLIPADIEKQIINAKAQITRVTNTRAALAELSAKAYDNPARKLKIIGITGTKGKSTTTFLVEHILRTAGYKTALLSTVENRIDTSSIPTALTTQQPDYLHTFFNECVKQKIEYVVMEVAAQAFTLHRVDGLEFDGAIFTNFSQEHAEFYPTQDDYFAAKQQIIQHLKPHAPFVINGDDKRVAALQSLWDHVVQFGMQESDLDYKGSISSDSLNGCVSTITVQDKTLELSAPALTGTFNVYNMLAATAVADQLNVSSAHIQEAFKTFSGVPGRLSKYTLSNGATVFIDYAHNPSSYHAVLSTLRAYTSHLIVVFGAGGDRDATKRPLMGAAASAWADQLIITSDNPRSEDPAIIAQQIITGIDQSKKESLILELDRKAAICKAAHCARSDSIIVLLGKGPDEYQLIKGVKYPFSEREIVQSL